MNISISRRARPLSACLLAGILTCCLNSCRNNLTYWRLPSYNSVRFVFTCTLGLIVGAVYWRLGDRRSAAPAPHLLAFPLPLHVIACSLAIAFSLALDCYECIALWQPLEAS